MIQDREREREREPQNGSFITLFYGRSQRQNDYLTRRPDYLFIERQHEKYGSLFMSHLSKLKEKKLLQKETRFLMENEVAPLIYITIQL